MPSAILDMIKKIHKKHSGLKNMEKLSGSSNQKVVMDYNFLHLVPAKKEGKFQCGFCGKKVNSLHKHKQSGWMCILCLNKN